MTIQPGFTRPDKVVVANGHRERPFVMEVEDKQEQSATLSFERHPIGSLLLRFS